MYVTPNFISGSRVCVECLSSIREGSEGQEGQTCRSLFKPGSPTRKFRMSQKCHGKLTYLMVTPQPGQCSASLSCQKGLNFQIQPNSFD